MEVALSVRPSLGLPKPQRHISLGGMLGGVAASAVMVEPEARRWTLVYEAAPWQEAWQIPRVSGPKVEMSVLFLI